MCFAEYRKVREMLRFNTLLNIHAQTRKIVEIMIASQSHSSLRTAQLTYIGSTTVVNEKPTVTPSLF